MTMTPRLYEAAMKGQIEILFHYIDKFEGQLTRNNNTVLHVAAQYGQLSCVLEILKVCPPSLLHNENCEGETPLHIAARGGNLDIVRAIINLTKEVESKGREENVGRFQSLIDRAGNLGIVRALIDQAGKLGKFQKLINREKQVKSEELLRATNLDKDTALHIAVQNGHLGIVKFLTEEDREFSYPANKAGETPLYLAVERGDFEMVNTILEDCASRDYSGPCGRTALHEAATKDITTRLEWKAKLIDKPDAHGWTALHYAAHCGNVSGVRKLLQINPRLGNIKAGEKDYGKTALHMAAAVGNVEVMEEILLACPDCWDMVDSKGHNILHVAAEMEREEVINFILGMPYWRQLINQKSIEGDTPIHLLAASKLILKMPLTESDGFWFAFNVKNIRPVDVALSQAGYNPERRIVNMRNMVGNYHDKMEKWRGDRTKRPEEKEKAQEDEEKEKTQEDRKGKEKAERADKMAETHMVVAALIATITFAASFAIPGGYVPDGSPDQGMAVLLRKAAFKAFIITNAIAVLCSTSSVLQYVIASVCHDEGRRIEQYANAFNLIILAMPAMMVMFITGTYSMLSNYKGLAITTTVIGCLFLYRNFGELGRFWKLLGSPLHYISGLKKLFSN